MPDGWLVVLTFCTALGCGLVAGVFFAFSTFVMKALARLAPAQGIAAMQSINVVAISPLFMAALFGTAVGCVVLGVFSLLRWGTPGYVKSWTAWNHVRPRVRVRGPCRSEAA